MKRLVIASAVLVSFTACTPVLHDHGPGYDRGPPAHAPAHGYRKKMHGHELSYDAGLGVYVVIGSPSLYFWDDFYWQLRDGIWVRASVFDGPWLVVEDRYRQLPPGLAKKHGYGKDKGQGKGKDKQKEKNKNK